MPSGTLQFTHLTWPAAPRFAARLVFLTEVLRLHERTEASSDPAGEAELSLLSEAVLSAAKFQEIGSSGAPLEAFLDSLARIAQAHTLSSDIVGEIREGFVARSALLRCSTCTTRTACNGQDAFHDDSLLRDFGACLGDLRQIFDDAVRLATGQYARLGFAEVPVEFGTEFVDRLGKSGATFPVAGITEMGSAPESRMLRLHVNPALFDLSSYLAQYYVFVHEALVHAYAGIAPGDGEAVAADPYAEGWMDWIAVDVMNEWVGSAVAARWSFPQRTAFAREAEHYHRTRMKTTSRYRIGAAAAEKLLFAMTQLCIDGEEAARRRFRDFSLRFNASRRGGSERGRLVRCVNALLQKFRTASDCSPCAVRAVRAVATYLEDGDDLALADALLSEGSALLGASPTA